VASTKRFMKQTEV